jgi:hypothetical protein
MIMMSVMIFRLSENARQRIAILDHVLLAIMLTFVVQNREKDEVDAIPQCQDRNPSKIRVNSAVRE